MAATPHEAINGRLLATSAVTTLIGQRAYPALPTQDPPGDYVVHTVRAGGDGARLGGTARLRAYDVELEVYAETDARAQAILAAVRDALDGWQDRPNGVQGCFAQGDASDDVRGDGSRITGQTFTIWFKPQ